jgi:hypothetical protein
MIVRVAVVSLAAAIAGCGGADQILVVCSMNLVPAVIVTARDSATSETLTTSITVIATRSRGTSDTTRSFNPVLVNGDPGKYDLLVRAAGYADWSQMNINVVWDESQCHPVPVQLAPKLQAVH